VSKLRQWLFPALFRIQAPREDEERLLLDLLAELPDGTSADLAVVASAVQDGKLFAQLGTHLWRLQNRLQPAGATQPPPQTQRALRHLEAAWEALREAGLEIEDHTGRPYDAGQLLKVIAAQPVPNLTTEQVIETVKPSIFYKNQLVQIGEVVVGIPEEKAQ
jgi:hypothetical protein